MEQKLLLHIPHSSTSFPEESGYTFDDLNNDERLLIDYYTDELFLPEQPSANIESVVFPYCRLYCDVERLINDPLEKEGLGISYLRRTYNPTQQPRFFSTLQSAFPLYADHHSLVAKKLVSMGDGTLLIDCLTAIRPTSTSASDITMMTHGPTMQFSLESSDTLPYLAIKSASTLPSPTARHSTCR